MNALARTLPRRVHHIRDKRQRHGRYRPPVLQKLPARTPHIRQTVDVQLEHLRRILRTDAVTRAQILVQANTSVLAQANSSPQNVLSLLRG